MTLTDTTTEDRYPTRVQGEPSLIERTDPTVWSTGVAGPIDPATLAAHDAKGYSIYDGLLSPGEVQAYWEELVRLSSSERLKADERTIVEKQSGEVRSIFEVHKISSLIAELVRDPRVLDRARQVLGSEVYIHQSRVNYMPGFKGTGFYWHSDFETWHAEDGMPLPRAVSMSIALTDNFPFNGGLMVMPGSHRTFVPCVGETPADHYKASLKEQEIGVPEPGGHHHAGRELRDRPVHRHRGLGAAVRLEHHARLGQQHHAVPALEHLRRVQQRGEHPDRAVRGTPAEAGLHRRQGLHAVASLTPCGDHLLAVC